VQKPRSVRTQSEELRQRESCKEMLAPYASPLPMWQKQAARIAVAIERVERGKGSADGLQRQIETLRASITPHRRSFYDRDSAPDPTGIGSDIGRSLERLVAELEEFESRLSARAGGRSP
jgi:hypothetical protein